MWPVKPSLSAMAKATIPQRRGYEKFRKRRSYSEQQKTKHVWWQLTLLHPGQLVQAQLGRSFSISSIKRSRPQERAAGHRGGAVPLGNEGCSEVPAGHVKQFFMCDAVPLLENFSSTCGDFPQKQRQATRRPFCATLLPSYDGFFIQVALISP